MKLSKTALLILGATLSACQSNSSGSKTSSPDTAATSNTPQAELIIPGKSIGDLFIGQDMTAVANIMGEPDAGDAAMGKAWGIWYDKNLSGKEQTEISIYSSYKDSTMMVKSVKQIRTTAGKFKTPDGMSVGSTLDRFQAAYPDIQLRSQYRIGSTGDTVKFFDSRSRGISAEIVKSTIKALSVHAMNSDAVESYFTYDPKTIKLNQDQ